MFQHRVSGDHHALLDAGAGDPLQQGRPQVGGDGLENRECNARQFAVLVSPHWTGWSCGSGHGGRQYNSLSRTRYSRQGSGRQQYRRLVVGSVAADLVGQPPGRPHTLLDILDQAVARLQPGVVVQCRPDLGANLLQHISTQ